MSTSPPSRITAARARAETAKLVLLVAALLSFFAAMLVERGAAASASTPSSSGSTRSSWEEDEDGFRFEPGNVAPSTSAPQTSTGTS